MQALTTINKSLATYQVRIILLVAVSMIFMGISIIHASDSEITPTRSDLPSKPALETYLLNTPPLNSLEAGQARYVASINWADYVEIETVDAMAQSLLDTTPRLGYKDKNWNIYVASINWADYAD